MSTIEKLLAKSRLKNGNFLTLEQHLLDTEESAYHLFRLDKRLGQNWCRFFKLSTSVLRDKFLLNLRVAALFHDIGKANEDFLAAVSKSGFLPQTLRHEHLSALILCLPEIRVWLSENKDLDLDIITAAVLSHHLKASKDDATTRNGQSYEWGEAKGLKQSFKLYLDHPQVKDTLGKISEIANLPINLLPKLAQCDWGIDPAWKEAIENGRKWANKLKKVISKDGGEEQRLFLAAVKAGLIASDAVASGLVREDLNITDWIDDTVHGDVISADEIANEIIYPRLGQIKAKKENKSFELDKFRAEHTKEQLEKLRAEMLLKFQTNLEYQSSRTLLLAGCGVGKTLAAWVWAESQSKQYQISKVIFLYPTRGTALEGFKDYVSWAPEADVALVTGTARYELEAMRENPDDEKHTQKIYRTEADERLFAMGFWSKRFFSATVDQFLSFMEHSYQSLCLIPALVDSVVIIDEVHSFDRSMFDNLISFLKHFDIPVLCMTATLPQSRRDELVEAGLKVFPTENDRVDLQDLEAKEKNERYQIHRVENFDAAYTQAVNAYQRDNKRVLWVVNTVDRCIAIAEKLSTEYGIQALTYHSRFTLEDRQKVHAQTVTAFGIETGKPPQQAIAITTQVCEMSLDLDADVLITEIAPISSLVQRFGRANRHLFRDVADIYIYELPKGKEKPYQKEELSVATDFLNSLVNSRISQYRLAQGLEEYARKERHADGLARFLTSGYYATPGSFRDDDNDFTVPCILDRDLELVKPFLKKGSKERYRKDRYIINIPKKWAISDASKPAWMPKYLGIAPSERYHKNRGFMTKECSEVELG
jgi:CRISPR-associated endonuclease/helicase Cas3